MKVKKLLRFIVVLPIAPITLLMMLAIAIMECLENEPDWEFYRKHWLRDTKASSWLLFR